MTKHATLLGAILLGLVSALSYAQAPVPFINQPLIPDATAPGGPQFTLTVNGTGFASNSVVNWNGSALATQFVSGSQLKAIVPVADITTKGTRWVTVVNPAPGGGTSNIAFFTVSAKSKYAAFRLASSPATGANPNSVVVGDFNGDGKLDLAVANRTSNTVSILLGDGTGNFTQASTPAVGRWPTSLAVGDFNGDGKFDLAVANFDDNTVSILLGDGTGNFTVASSPEAYGGPYSVAVGDFNRDGKLDLAVANVRGGVSILLGDGTGQFTSASYSDGAEAPSIAVGDFNEDGDLDLAIPNFNEASSGTVPILLGDGLGHFALASAPVTGMGPASVVIGDFDGDGNLDLATANAGDNTVSILLGDGAGNFTLASSPAAGSWPWSVAEADLNGDGNLDLAVANWGGGTVSVFLGNGTGNFTLASSPAAGGGPWSVAVGDFDGDGKLDLAVANRDSNTVSIVLQVPASPAVKLSPASLTFETQLVFTQSNPQPVTLSNVGNAPLRITRIAASWFSQTNNCPPSVPPNEQCTINVTFRPHSRGKFVGAVRITDNAPNSPQKVPLTGVGTAVTLLPPSLGFGNQQVGTTSQPQEVTLTNHGIAAVSIWRIHFTGNNPGAFAQTNTCGTSVPAGGTCTISVTFTPHSKGQKNATLDVRDNGGGSPQTVALSGNGTR